jgi:hypothetical protein
MNLKTLEKKRAKLEAQLEKVEEEIEAEEIRRKSFKPLICGCGRDVWKISTTYNPLMKMAYEWRELIIECECGKTEHINVQEDI